MEGIICQWKDDKGFGFILPSDGSDQLFFHISSVKNAETRPKAGEAVAYDVSRDAQQRCIAINIVISRENTPEPQTGQSIIKTQSPYQRLIDAILLFIVLAVCSGVTYQYLQTQNIEYAWLLALPAGIILFLMMRPKRPKDSHFTCTGCRVKAHYEPRTLAAWQAGFTQLYCQQCHSQWLRNRPKKAVQPGSNSSISRTRDHGGCVGGLLILVLIPVITSVGLYHWLA